MTTDIWFMKLAIEEAENAFHLGEVPVGAVLVDETGQILARSFNRRESTSNPISHAELNCLIEAGSKVKQWRLVGTTIYCTLSPCVMCLDALNQARVSRIVFGAYDFKGGAFERSYRDLFRGSVTGGVMHYQSSQLLSQFFRERRNSYPATSK